MNHKETKTMEQCSPVEMRKNLEVVETFKSYGIDFVCIPAKNEAHKKELLAQSQQVLDELSREL